MHTESDALVQLLYSPELHDEDGHSVHTESDVPLHPLDRYWPELQVVHVAYILFLVPVGNPDIIHNLLLNYSLVCAHLMPATVPSLLSSCVQLDPSIVYQIKSDAMIKLLPPPIM